MLPKTARMRSSEEFRSAMRHGVRTGRATLVVHASRVEPSDRHATLGTEVRVGFVVSKAVGNAVTRNRVKRRLRHLAAEALAATPPGTRVVVRALPRAATNPSELPDDLDKAWEKALHRLTERQPVVSRRSRP
ncbi:MAG: ribonuclease P protein component [Propionibacteriaceae bacterium]